MPTEEDRCGPARLVTSHGALGSWVSYLDVGNTGGCKWKLNLKLVSCQFLFFCLVYGYSLQRVFGLSFGYLDNPIIVWSYRSIFKKSFAANLRCGRCGQLPTSIKTPGQNQRSSFSSITNHNEDVLNNSRKVYTPRIYYYDSPLRFLSSGHTLTSASIPDNQKSENLRTNLQYISPFRA